MEEKLLCNQKAWSLSWLTQSPGHSPLGPSFSDLDSQVLQRPWSPPSPWIVEMAGLWKWLL